MIFSELYGTYYNTVAKILEKALCSPITTEELYSCIKENAYDESLISITDAINKEKWQLLKFDRKKKQLFFYYKAQSQDAADTSSKAVSKSAFGR